MTHTTETLASARQHLVSAQDFIARAMERLEPDPYAELKAAHAAGKTIQVNLNHYYPERGEDWEDARRLYWDSDVTAYRIKPEPPSPCPHTSGTTFREGQPECASCGARMVHTVAGYKVPPAGEWREWAGGTCPVDTSTRVEVRYRNGECSGNKALYFEWEYSFTHEDEPGDIIAYRVVEAAVEAAEQPCVALTQERKVATWCPVSCVAWGTKPPSDADSLKQFLDAECTDGWEFAAMAQTLSGLLCTFTRKARDASQA